MDKGFALLWKAYSENQDVKITKESSKTMESSIVKKDRR